MLPAAELIEFPNDFVKVVAEGAEQDGELALLLLMIDKSPEERWDQVELALTEHVHFELVFFSELVLIIFSLLIIVERLTSLNFQWEIQRIIKLLLRALWKCQCLEHLLLAVFEFGSETSWLCETEDPINLDLLVVLSNVGVLVIERIVLLEEVPISYDCNLDQLTSFLILDLDVLGLVPGQLVVGEVPIWN